MESPVQPARKNTPELVRVASLRVHFKKYGGPLQRQEQGIVRAVDGLSFTLRQGEIMALVGAKGCGKTTAARAVALLDPPTDGRIYFEGHNLTSWRGRHFKRARRRIQMIFSNPYIAFAPRMTVKEIIVEALGFDKRWFGRDRDEQVAGLLAQTGLNYYFSIRYPRDLSGGQRQRLALARALAAEPALLVCDQPTDHLDPWMGDAIVELIYQLSRQLGLAVLLTARHLKLARQVDRVAVMIQGRIVEMGYHDDLIRQPLHPFTQALLNHSLQNATALPASAPLDPATGCHYAPVCPLVEARCRERFPAFVEGAPHHGVACHLVDPVQADSPNALAI